jgi:dynein heavy chain 2, cytosolic
MSNDDSKEKALVFYKIRPDLITPDNIHTNIFISSILGSPLSTFYQSVHNVYVPMLLKDDKQSLDPKLQSLLGELDAGLGSVLRRRADQSGPAKGSSVADDALGGKQYAAWHAVLFAWCKYSYGN